MSEVGGRNARRKAQRVGLARARANAATDVLKKSSRGLCTVNYERLAGCELSARPSSLNSLETPCNAGTACRTDSEDAWRSKRRGIMLREPKTPASNKTPPKALHAAQREASGAARRGWSGEAAQTSTLMPFG